MMFPDNGRARDRAVPVLLILRVCLAWLIAAPLQAATGQEDATRHHRQHADHPEHAEHRTVIAPATADAAGIQLAVAGPAELRQSIALFGRIEPATGGRVQVAAPFPGIVQSVAVAEGDTVAQGDVLATVRNSDSLQTYAVAAPSAGVVAGRHIDPGAATGSEPLMTLLNLDEVWAVVSAFPADLDQLDVGQPAQVAAVFARTAATARVDYMATVSTRAQVTAVRLVLDNGDGRWRPGQAVQATITVARAEVPVAVAAAAVQTMAGEPVVFVRDGAAFAARSVQLGRRDGALVEIVAGLQPGERYVSSNSFLIKADLLKSGASHAH